MMNLVADIRDARGRMRLRLMNRRVVEWLVLPVCVTLMIWAELSLLATGNHVVVPFIVLAALALGVGLTRWRLKNARFWFRFHSTIFDHAKTHLCSDDRQQWFAQVRHWMELHGLVGHAASRLLYSRDEREFLASTYEVVVRRATNQANLAPSQEASNLSVALQAEYRDLQDQIEELPQAGSLLFYTLYWRHEAITSALTFFVILAGMAGVILRVAEIPNKPFSARFEQAQPHSELPQ